MPWNFPLLMAAWKIAPALACGNTVVLKPAETTPLTALRLAEICAEIDLPPGVVNIVTGDGSTGAALASHRDIHKLAFTGSTDVGKKLAKLAAERGDGLRLTLELGGKSPNIIFDDASIDQAIEGIIQGIYFNQGHVCCAGSRLFVQEGIASDVVERLRIRMQSLRVGDPMDKNTDVGAINSKGQLQKIEDYLRIGEEEGAELFRANGNRQGGSRQGLLLRALLLHRRAAVPPHRTENLRPRPRRPNLPHPEEALSRANNTPYGLAAGVWTDKGSKVFEIATKLKAGVIWCNTYNKFDAASPFGGFKESGFGREGGMQGLRAYVRI
ncbi:MAG: aldehyde dehydrogenase family protein [Phycisphaerales bacterium]